MDKEQAEALAALIKSQFAGAYVLVLESSDRHQAPHNWFVAVKRSETDPDLALILLRELDWNYALRAYSILKALE